MSLDIYRKDSKELVRYIKNLMYEISDDVANLTRLNNELLEKQLSDDNPNTSPICEKIGDCEENIENEMYEIAIAICNLFNFVFLALKESNEEIKNEIIDNEYETAYEMKNINDKIDDIEKILAEINTS